MIAFTDLIISDLLEKLERVDHGGTRALTDTHLCIRLTSESIKSVHDKLSDFRFDSAIEEIHFFKNLKPVLDGRMIYYQFLLGIQHLLPAADTQTQIEFYKEQLKAITSFRTRHNEMYMYRQLECAHLDSFYFTRSEGGLLLPQQPLPVYIDRQVNAPASYFYGYFLGLSLLEVYLQTQLEACHQLLLPVSTTVSEDMAWTGSQAALTELMYALNEMGVIGGGKQEISRLARFFENTFHFKLGNVYKNHESNRLRKKNRTAFLDTMRLALLRKYDQDDEFAL